MKTATLLQQVRNLGLSVLSSIAIAGCASMGEKLDAGRAKAIRRVAILSFEVQQQKPTDNLGFTQLEALKNGSPADSKELQTMASTILKKAQENLEKQTGWKFTAVEKVRTSPAYANKVTASTSGWQAMTADTTKYEIVRIPGTMGLSNFRNLKFDEQTAIAKELGVDAFAELVVVENIDQSALSFGHAFGRGAFSFTAQTSLRVWGLDSPEVLWQVNSIQGQASQNSDALDEKLSKHERLARIGEEAALSSLQRLAEKYKAM